MKYQAVFFDLDGTVSDTLLNITDAVNHTMTHFGRPAFHPETLRPKLGWGVDFLMKQLLPELTEAELGEYMAFYRPYYAQHTRDKVQPYPGILPMLEALKAAGLKLAIVSNKPDAAVQPLVERDFRGLISFAVGELPGVARKPEPDLLLLAADRLGVELSQCVYVGDTEVDVETAANSHMDCLCVTWGFRTRQALEQAGAKTIVETPEGLLRCIFDDF